MILLDTHALIWYLDDPGNLSCRAEEALYAGFSKEVTMNHLIRILGVAIASLLVVLAGTLLAFKLRKPVPEPSRGDERRGSLPQVQEPADLRAPGMTRLVERLSERVGVHPELVRKHLADLRIAPPSASGGETVSASGSDTAGRQPDPPAPLSTRTPAPGDLQEAIEYGLRLARLDDDYARRGLEYETAPGPDEFAVELIDEMVRDRLELTGKLAAALQEMHRLGEFPGSQAPIAQLLRQLNRASRELQERMVQRTTMRLDELGTRADRQLYDFQVGVIKHLRRRGLLPELLALYRAGTTESALDYADEEALRILRRKCPRFALLESRGIQYLLSALRDEIGDALWPVLPENTAAKGHGPAAGSLQKEGGPIGTA